MDGPHLPAPPRSQLRGEAEWAGTHGAQPTLAGRTRGHAGTPKALSIRAKAAGREFSQTGFPAAIL